MFSLYSQYVSGASDETTAGSQTLLRFTVSEEVFSLSGGDYEIGRSVCRGVCLCLRLCTCL